MSEHHDNPSPSGSKGSKTTFVAKVAAAVFFVLLAVGAGTVAAFAKLDGAKIAHGVAIAGEDVSMLAPEAAQAAIKARAEALPLTFRLEGEQLILSPNKVTDIATADVDAAVKRAAAVGRDGGPIAGFSSRLRAAFVGVNVGVPHALDRVALRQAVETHFAESVSPAKNAGFDVSFDFSGQPSVTITEPTDGLDINYDAVMTAVEKRLSSLSNEPIDLDVRRDKATLTSDKVRPLSDGAAAAIMRAPFTLVAKGKTYTVPRSVFADWIIASANDRGEATLSLDRDLAAEFLQEKTADISTAPKDAIFEEKDGEVIKFNSHVNGEEVDVDATLAKLTDVAFKTVIDGDHGTRIEMPLHVVEPEITTEKSNPYGIREIIGSGASNFRGSPANRRHNIGVGASTVNGTLIPPGEEFSMIKTLGVIDGTSGYKQELVIKENRTIPEYGGGLCQIGSTAFRAALDSGLPITMRKNHSYRVPYYERDGDGNYIGPGKDATIYDPLPDFRFANDTDGHIMIITSIEGDKVTFTFWGRDDGRVAEQTAARVYNIVQPPPTKIIQTTSLPVGQRKCTESPHVGSNAAFDYKVTMPDGEVREKEFVSHYRPWQEVCLVGVDAATLPPGVTSQELIIPSPDSPSADAPGAGTEPQATTPPAETPTPAAEAPTTP